MFGFFQGGIEHHVNPQKKNYIPDELKLKFFITELLKSLEENIDKYLSNFWVGKAFLSMKVKE